MTLEAILLCLALNIYYESSMEPKLGKQAVAYVTLNRAVKKEKICDTVYAPKQFSWTAEEKESPYGSMWVESQKVAKEVLFRKVADPTNGATHFHNDTVNPKWTKNLEKIVTIGKHTFYK